MKILCVGEMLVDVLVTGSPGISYDNGTRIADEILMKPGGDAFNNSIDFARLGQEVTYVGCISNDAAGQFLMQEGLREGVNMSHVIPSEYPQTKMTILVDRNGNRCFLYYPGTSRQLRFEDIDLTLLDRCDLVHVGSTFHMPGFDGEGTAALFSAARRYGIPTSMDVTTDFSNRWNEILKPVYLYLDYFLPSIEQAEKIAGTSDVHRIADFFLSRGVKNVVIKCGSEGSYFSDGIRSFRCGCYKVPAIETTGAGDSFTAGFMTAVLEGKTPEQCAVTGSACAAHVVQGVGATTLMPDRLALRKFMSSTPAPDINYL